jgi:hypothetical protein
MKTITVAGSTCAMTSVSPIAAETLRQMAGQTSARAAPHPLKKFTVKL